MTESPEKRERPGGRSGEHPWRDDPYSNTERPPFEPGNTAGLHHGANSEQTLRPIAERLEREIVTIAPWCARPAFAAAVRAWAWAEAQCELYRAWFAEHGLRDEENQPVTGLANWDRAEARASKLRARLSLDPNALAKLLSSLASVAASGGDSQGLAAVKAEGAAIVAARERQLERVDNEDEEGEGQ
jgi:hypothetical protein